MTNEERKSGKTEKGSGGARKAGEQGSNSQKQRLLRPVTTTSLSGKIIQPDGFYFNAIYNAKSPDPFFFPAHRKS